MADKQASRHYSGAGGDEWVAGAMRRRQRQPQRFQQGHDDGFMKASSERVKLASGRVSSVIRRRGGAVLPGAFPLGPFIVEESGKLGFRSPANGAGFSFAWRGRRFSATLGDASISLTALVGLVPSSAHGTERREAALAALRALPRALPAGWAMRLTSDHRIQIKAVEGMAWPAHATDLMLPLVRFLLCLGPYLDLMDESHLGPAA